MTTDTLTIRFTAVSTRLSAIPTGPQTVGLPAPPKIRLPVGLSSLGVPALEASSCAFTFTVDAGCTGLWHWSRRQSGQHLCAHPGNRHARKLNQSPTRGYSRVCLPNDHVGGWAPRDFVSTGKCVPSHQSARPSTTVVLSTQKSQRAVST